MATHPTAGATAGLALLAFAGTATAQNHTQDHNHDHHPAPATTPAQTDPHAGHQMPAPTPQEPADPHAGHDMSGMDHGAHAGHDMSDDGEHVMSGALGPWPMGREASGTSWQPDASIHGGVHSNLGDWMVMSHALVNLVWDRQEGPRGDEKTFVNGMLMTSARREYSDGSTLNLRAMLSPDPLMGAEGYPLLLAAGETADGVTPLVDRQHPHELVMELSASYSRRLSETDSVFVYLGLPGEPAFGPPAFMHRMSAMDSPEAPITHHWLDSTHIVFGVATVGWAHGPFKLEASGFRGREPDEDRWDIESPDLDSIALRASWNPTPEWSLQASWADATSPEQLEPDEDSRKWSASAIHTRRIGADGWWSTTVAWGRKSGAHGEYNDGWLFETAVHPVEAWTVFARAERIETDELEPVAGGHHGEVHVASKASLGVVRDWRVAEHVQIGLGGLYSFNRVPDALRAQYGEDHDGAMVFLRLKID